MAFNLSALDSTKVPEPPDSELIAALRNGQTEVMGQLYDRYAKLVYSLARRMLENAEEAEDLTQEVFLALWRRDSYDPSRGSLSSFLMTLTRSRAIDRLRSRGTQVKRLQEWQAMLHGETASVSPFEHAVRDERASLMQAALAKLSEAERQVLEIAYYEGLSQTAIAERLGIPLGTIKTRSRQGLLKLRQTLEDCI